MIFSIAMGADYQFYVKFIATRAPTFFEYIISVLGSVALELTTLRYAKMAIYLFRHYLSKVSREIIFVQT